VLGSAPAAQHPPSAGASSFTSRHGASRHIDPCASRDAPATGRGSGWTQPCAGLASTIYAVNTVHATAIRDWSNGPRCESVRFADRLAASCRHPPSAMTRRPGLRPRTTARTSCRPSLEPGAERRGKPRRGAEGRLGVGILYRRQRQFGWRQALGDPKQSTRRKTTVHSTGPCSSGRRRARAPFNGVQPGTCLPLPNRHLPIVDAVRDGFAGRT